MKKKADHSLLNDAKTNKKDEFYTLLEDIERELQHYINHFKNKTVFCNCDDYKNSNFFNYFFKNFDKLGLKKLICSCYKKNSNSLIDGYTSGYYYVYTGTETTLQNPIYFTGDGDFRSSESIKLLKQSDIVVTNPPFSLFRQYLSQLIKYEKLFLVICNINAITYKEIFNLIKDNKVWLGVNLGRGISGFTVPSSYNLYGLETKINTKGQKIISTNNCMWLTNLDNLKHHEFIPLTKKYFGNESLYPFYDNYDAINIDRTRDIPSDFDGAMGVPITFLHKFNPSQFEIIKFRKGNDDKDLSINDKPTYFRILIKKIADYKGPPKTRNI